MNLNIVKTPIKTNEETVQNKSKTEHIGRKMSRNEPCFCGSGKKYKRCCGAL